jgi:Tfp pilus assembly protein PilF
MVAAARGDRAGARAAFEKALALDPRLIEPLEALVAMDFQEKQPAAARARVEQRVQQTPDSSAALALAGRAWAASGDPAKGERYLRQAIATDPANLDAYSHLARLYWSQRKLDQAVVEYDRLAERQQGSVEASTMAAIILRAQGKDDEARRRFELIVGANPHAAVAANNLAWMYVTRGVQLDRALALAQSAKAAMPDEPEINDTLGFIYLKKQLPALAIPPLMFATEKAPQNALFHYHLGLAYAQRQEKAAARRHLERALSLDSKFDGSDDARALLQTIR